ncbi:MAG TPA: 50S ribosomal protein L21 [Allosphingosinicella sp.]|jgi:large subunit ribosomal protein L21
MFAVVRTGGKQYRVAAGDKIVVEKLAGEAGDTIQLGDILLAGEGADLRSTEGLLISAEIIAQAKADKVIVFKKRRRHNYRRKAGHRQQHTILRITAIGDHKAEDKQAKTQAETPVAADQGPAAAAAPAPEAAASESPAKKPRAKKAAPDAPAATDLQPQAPLKVDGAESPMTDSPVESKNDAA